MAPLSELKIIDQFPRIIPVFRRKGVNKNQLVLWLIEAKNADIAGATSRLFNEE